MQPISCLYMRMVILQSDPTISFLSDSIIAIQKSYSRRSHLDYSHIKESNALYRLKVFTAFPSIGHALIYIMSSITMKTTT